uniref:HAT C-terminal dimerisation domain-containing protein n=1 Tax=Ditylenchus dipsaci TaxID=166011 RepID=A0A915DCL8_9BILA
MGKAFKDVFEVDVNLQFLDEDEDCEFVDGIDDENTTDNIPEVDVIICSAFPLRVKRVAHSLQLAIVDEFRMCVLPSSAYSKMMDVVRAFRKSPLAIQELDEATGKALLSVSNTRWSYQILGIQRYLEQLSEEDFNVAVNSIQNLIRFEQPEVMEEPASVVCLDATLDRLMEEYARKQASQRKQKEPNRGKSWVVQILQRVIGMNPFGKEKIDSLKYWTSLIETEVQPVAKLALEVLSVSISSAPVERIFSQAGLATARHRNRTKLDLLNSQLFIRCNRNV